MKKVVLDGSSLDLGDVLSISNGAEVKIGQSSINRLKKTRAIVEKAARGPKPIYGVNTGFGWLANKRISHERLEELQQHILLSHASGLGPILSSRETRLAMALRLNVLLKGYTGVRLVLCERLAQLINAEIYPTIPEYGSLGASGDLLPLAHLALPLIGEGNVMYQGKIIPAKTALKKAHIEPLELEAKEGLSLVNGTQIMLAVGSLAIVQAIQLMKYADLAAALSYEGANAHLDPLNPLIHALRGHQGQIDSARRILSLLEGSYLHMPSDRMRVQDPYSLRCAPQVHGASRDMIEYAAKVVGVELNAATDNPLVDPEEKKIINGGNFHGQPLALAFDAAAMAVSELGNISERRLEVLLNPHLSGLPAFLTPDPGINSGYMGLQYAAGSLLNENKVLCHPACVDNIPGNVGIEDHVSMGMTSARKLRQIVANTKSILALELLAACQAVDLRGAAPLGKGTSRLYGALREHVVRLEADRLVHLDILLAIKALDNFLEADD